MGYSSASLFLVRKREAVTQGGTHWDRPLDGKDNPGRRYRQMLGGKARQYKHTVMGKVRDRMEVKEL